MDARKPERLPIVRMLLGLAVALLCLVLASVLTTVGARNEDDTRGFSDTQEWNSELYATRESPVSIIGARAYEIVLPPPPSNSSEETKNELSELHRLAELRTENMRATIERELTSKGMQFGASSYQTIVEAHPITNRVLFEVLTEFNSVILQQKEGFDRIRPSVLDVTLTTVIPVPGHPAYPSGHAAQSWLIAHLLGYVNPVEADAYFASARSIAHNREIAGVHYASDSSAGRMLADKYMELLLETPETKLLLDRMRAEWE